MNKRRILFSFIISILMVLSLMPQVSFAADSSSACHITGFVPLETDSYYYEGDPMESDITANLPDTLEVYLDGGQSPTTINVRWESVEDFDETEFYFYSLKPVWDDSYTLSSDLSEVLDVPWITVYKQEPLSDMCEPMVTEDEASPIYVDEEEAAAEYGEGVYEEPYTVEDTDADDADSDSVTETDEVIDTEPDEDVNEEQENEDTAFNLLRFFADEAYADKETNTDKVYKYLTKTMGLNMAAACGVMTNINAESGMNPINLENRYNTIYGLTDSEYTKRVDEGKGAYKTKSGKKRNFKTDYCGYGLCQWTSLGRRTNLLEKALKKKVSVGNITMQLEFLNDELDSSYSSVINTLKSVPNNAQGAYVAAFIFCNNFEVPANTINTATSRAKTCIGKGGYWHKYSGKVGNLSGKSVLSISGYKYPVSLKAGKGMTVNGIVISNHDITKVSASIKDENGVKKYYKSSKPGTKYFSLYKFDDDLLFGKLDTGKYKYTVYAKDKSGETVKAVHTFTVKSSGSNETRIGFCMEGSTPSQPAVDPADPGTGGESTLAIYDFNYPKTMKKGKPFSVRGKIKSNHPIRKVTVKVVKISNNKTKISASKKLTGTKKSYSLQKLDNKLKFGKLARGKYRYKVIVKDTKTTKTLVNKKFRVK